MMLTDLQCVRIHASVNLNTGGSDFDYDTSFSASIASAGHGALIRKVTIHKGNLTNP